MRRDLAWLVCILTALSCAKSFDPLPNKNTNWLRDCVGDLTCGSGLSCMCGVCTKACEAARECGVDGSDVACKATAGAALQSQCGDPEAKGSICVATCTHDRDCATHGKGWECSHAVCAKTASGTPGSMDAGLRDGGAATTDGGNGGVRIDASHPGSRPDAGPDAGSPMSSLCGNGKVDPGEDCDGTTTTIDHAQCVQCAIVCDSGRADCNADLADGCERVVMTTQDLPVAPAGVPEGCAEQLAAMQASPTSIALDATRVYWTNYGTVDSLGNYQEDGSLVAMPLAGGPVVTLAKDIASPGSIVLDGAYAYWVHGEFGDGRSDGQILRVELAGGKPEIVVDGMRNSGGLAIDSDHVYFFNSSDSDGGGIGMRAIWRAPKDGSASPELVLDGIHGTPGPLLIAKATLYWHADTAVSSVAVDGSGGLKTIGTTADLAGGGPNNVALDHDILYWIWDGSDGCGAGVTPIASGESTVLAKRMDEYSPSGIAVDVDFAYWGHAQGAKAGQADTVIERSAKQPGATTALLVVPGLGQSALAVNDSAIYVAGAGEWGKGNGLVVRIPK